MNSRTPLLGLVAGAALTLAVPAAASAVTGTLNQPCYSHIPTGSSEPVVVTLAGGTPNADFLVSATVPGKGSGSAGSASGTFDALGNGTAQITDVSPPSGTIGPTKGQIVTITAKDYGVAGAPDQPIGNATITNVALSIASKPRSPRAHRTVSVSGTPFANQPVFGFITKPGSSKVLRKLSFGTANACGFVSDKEIVAPRTYRTGKYRLYINAGSTLDKPKAIYATFTIYKRYF